MLRYGTIERQSESAEWVLPTFPGGLFDERERASQIALPTIRLFEQLESRRVGEVLQHHGVVERPVEKPGVSPLRKAHVPQLGPRAGEDALPLRQRRGLVGRGRIRRAQPRRERLHARREPPLVVPGGLGTQPPLPLATRREERDRTPIANEARQGLVEGRRVGTSEVERVVQQLVQNQVHEKLLVLPKQVPQQRIIEPAERAERGGTPHVRVVSQRLQALGLGLRATLLEEPLVRQAADDREPPGIGN